MPQDQVGVLKALAGASKISPPPPGPGVRMGIPGGSLLDRLAEMQTEGIFEGEPGPVELMLAGLPFFGAAANAAKMGVPAAAARLGFNTPAYHGTTSVDDFSRFRRTYSNPYDTGDFGHHVSLSPDSANARLGDVEEFARVMPLLVRANKPLDIPDMGVFKFPGEWATRLEGKAAGHPDPDMINELMELAKHYQRSGNASRFQRVLRATLNREGYDSLRYTNIMEPGELPSMALLHPSQIRSRFAKFDPARANSSDIMASLAAMIGAGAFVKRPQE